MASDEVQRLILEVRASTDIANRAMKQLAREIEQDTTKIDTSLGKVETGTQRMGQALAKTGQYRAGMQQLSFQVGDVAQQMALGTKASVIFAQQGGQVIQAIQLMTNGTGGFMKFLAGPWGIALTSAIVILSSFAGKLFETGDETSKLVDKMREQAAQAERNERANKIWAASLDGVRESQKRLREDAEKDLQFRVLEERKALDKANENLGIQRAGLPGAESKVRDLEAKRRDAAATVDGATDERSRQQAQAFLDQIDARLKSARGALAQLRKDIANSEQTIRAIGTRNALSDADASATRVGRASATIEVFTAQLAVAGQQGKQTSADIEAAATALKQYGDALGDLASKDVDVRKVGATAEVRKLTDSFAAGTGKLDAYVARLRSLTEALKKAAEAAKPKRNQGLTLAPVTGKEVAEALGTTINPGGGTRSVAQNKRVGGATNSYHLTGQAIDIPLTVNGKPLTKEGIRAALAPLGVDIKELLGPGDKDHDDHFHIAFGKKRLTPDQQARGVSRQQSIAERAEDRRVNQNDAFAAEMLQLEQQALQAQMELVTGITAQADFARLMVDAEQARYEQGLTNAVNDERLREEQAKLLVEKSRAVTTQKKANIAAREQLDMMEEARRDAELDAEFRMEGLRFEDEMAKTQSARRRIQLEILDIMYAEKEAQLRLAKAKAEQAGDAEEAARIQARINELPAQRSRDEGRTMDGTKNPLEEWADSVPQTADEINEAFMSIQARGLESLSSAIADVITGSKSLGEAFRGVAASIIGDIAQMIARMLVMRAMMAMFPGMFGGGAGAMSPATAAIGQSTMAGLGGGSLFGGIFPGLAGGGFGVFGGNAGVDTNVLQLNGRPIAKVSRDEQFAVIPQYPRLSMPRVAEGGGGRGGDTIHVSSTFHNHARISAREARRSQLQHAGLVGRDVARAVKRGVN
jgi:hypothetical protein